MKFLRVFITVLSWFLVHAAYIPPPYAEWAHSHVVWLNRDLKKDTELYDLVRKYKQNGIPVGGVNIDSTWSECINNFVFDRTKFPNPEAIAPYFHAQGIKVILWATSVINKQCAEYTEGVSKGYFLNGGKTVKWWHGQGAFVDFFNPAAKKWFQSLLDRIIDLGFDGWKCDGTDPMIQLLRPMPYSPYLKRYIRYRDYADEYYGTFYNYTKSKNPNALIMSRPVQSFQNALHWSFSPKYVMFAGWVGSQNNSVLGFQQAMINIIVSASRNYLNFGFDIGGYKRRQTPKKWVFIRWMQTGSLLPLMQNGGLGEHQPWNYDQETVTIYRNFVALHYNLKQFFLTAGTQCFAKGKSVLQPVIPDKKLIEIGVPKNLGYVLYGTFLVEPVFDENGYVQVIFPKGHKWLYFFNRNLSFQGTGVKQSMSIPLHQTPLFVREDTVFPFAGELWLVKLRQGERKQSVIGGDYSDEVTIKLQGTVLTITVNRFYKNEEIRAKRQGEKLRVRFIGMGKPQSEQVQSTQYPNQYFISINLNFMETLMIYV